MAERDFFLVNAALEAGRTEDAVAYTKQYAHSGSSLTLAEAKHTGKVLRTHMARLRKSWVALTRFTEKGKEELVGLYRGRIEREMESCGVDLAGLMENTLVLKTQDAETRAYVWKLAGDAWRYVAEVSTEETHSKSAESALDAYLKASALAVDLPPCNSVRLSVAINFSVFYFDILSSPVRAFKLSRSAYDAAVQTLASLPEAQRQEAEEAVAILTENLNYWVSGQPVSLQN
jgi:14-3-3 protein epsilon